MASETTTAEPLKCSRDAHVFNHPCTHCQCGQRIVQAAPGLTISGRVMQFDIPPTPTPLTDDQVAAIRARLEAIYVPTDRAKQRAADFLAHAPNDIASLLADRTALTRRLADYALLREAVNASTTACSSDCTDEHATQCPSHDPARWLIDQRREIAALTRRVEELERTIRFVATMPEMDLRYELARQEVARYRYATPPSASEAEVMRKLLFDMPTRACPTPADPTNGQ